MPRDGVSGMSDPFLPSVSPDDAWFEALPLTRTLLERAGVRPDLAQREVDLLESRGLLQVAFATRKARAVPRIVIVPFLH